jgi:hypothetical protein
MGKTTDAAVEVPADEQKESPVDAAEQGPLLAGSSHEISKALGRLQLDYEEQQLANCELRRYIGELEEKLQQSRATPVTDAITGVVEEDVKAVVKAFRHFLKVYYLFKKEHKLAHTYDDAKDMTLALMAKAGNIARLVKHEQRNDPKPDYLNGLERDMFGSIAYMTVIAARYGIEFDDGMAAELLSAVEQHADGQVTVVAEAPSA